MRKVQLLLVCLMFSVVALAAEKVIKLPKPNLGRTGSVMKALSERHSTREFAAKALSLSDLSDLLIYYGLLMELTAKTRVNAQLLLL